MNVIKFTNDLFGGILLNLVQLLERKNSEGGGRERSQDYSPIWTRWRNNFDFLLLLLFCRVGIVVPTSRALPLFQKIIPYTTCTAWMCAMLIIFLFHVGSFHYVLILMIGLQQVHKVISIVHILGGIIFLLFLEFFLHSFWPVTFEGCLINGRNRSRKGLEWESE